jgi:peroxiredoxin
MKKIKKITTLVSDNRKVIVRKGLVLTGVVLGIVAGALMVKPEEDAVIVGEVVTEETVIEAN